MLTLDEWIDMNSVALHTHARILISINSLRTLEKPFTQDENPSKKATTKKVEKRWMENICGKPYMGHYKFRFDEISGFGTAN